MFQNMEGMQRSAFGAAVGVVLAALLVVFCMSSAAQIAYADEPENPSASVVPIEGDSIAVADDTTDTVKTGDTASTVAGSDAVDANTGSTESESNPATKPATETPAPTPAPKPEQKPTKAGWLKDTDGTWYYFTKVNAKPATGWVKSGGKWYWMQPDKNGAMATNMWITDTNGKRYYLNKSGVMVKGWVQIGNDWYYTNKSGAQVTSGWVKSGGKWYWMLASEAGKMAKNAWISDSKGKQYYLTGSGAMKTGWVQNGSDWYYTNKSGARVMKGWLKSGGKWYWLQSDKQGLMFANGNKNIEGVDYSFESNGAMRANCQIDLGNNVVGYAASSGKISRIGEKKDGKLVLLNSAGQPLVGWQKLAGKWFYGQAGTGVAQTDWLKLGKTWYYFKSDGVMVTGTYTIKGKANIFTGSGKWIGVDGMATKAQGYSSGTGYLILVDRGLHRVGVFSGSKGHWNRIQSWSCVTGAPGSPTITGVFRTTGSKRMTLSTDSRAHWCTQIAGGYFFHTILASNSELGTSASHGCVRLAVSDAQWIYNHIGGGTTVVIYN